MGLFSKKRIDEEDKWREEAENWLWEKRRDIRTADDVLDYIDFKWELLGEKVHNSDDRWKVIRDLCQRVVSLESRLKKMESGNVVFYMDESEHYYHNKTGCCDDTGKRCHCGGWCHYQPIYGGYYYKCEICREEST